jgi:hypothetical protein
MVVKAHLALQATQRDLPSRKAWKMRLVRQLYEFGYNQGQVVDLFRFIDFTLALPQRLDRAFWTELQAYEEQISMPYISSIERMGYAQGKKEGHEKGREEGRCEVVLTLLGQKVGPLSQDWINRISELPDQRLQALTLALLQFDTQEDLSAWFQNN